MILDLFAGPGGWDEGLRLLGRSDVIGIEWDEHACATAEAAGHRRVQGDIAKLKPIHVADEYVGESNYVEGLIASPPCQGFSAAGKGKGRADTQRILATVARIADGQHPARCLADLRLAAADERSALVLEPLRWALDLEPEWCAWEQVPAVLPLWEACAEVLRADGYNVWTGNVQAEQYGVPQTRKRAILIASRSREVGRPTPTHSRYYPRNPGKLDDGVLPWVSMAEALGWGIAGRPSPTVTAGGTDTGGADTGGAEPIAHLSHRYTDRPDWTFRRPSTTIVGSFKPEVVASPGYRTKVSRQNAPDSVRVTVPEAGVLQSFRADYPWQGSKTAQYRQVGDAVPPLLAAHVLVEAMGLAASGEAVA